MKTQKRKKHESTIPQWVRKRTGDERMHGFQPIAPTDVMAIGLIMWFLLFTLGFGVFVMLIGIGVTFMFQIIDIPTLLRWSLTAYISYLFFRLCAIAAHWGYRAPAIRWLRREWRELTGIHTLPTYKEEAMRPLGDLASSPEKFHRARDIVSWLGYCEPELRPSHVVNPFRLMRQSE